MCESKIHIVIFIICLLFLKTNAQNRFTDKIEPVNLIVKVCELPSYDTNDRTPTISLDEKYMYFSSSRKSNDPLRKYLIELDRYDYDLFFREKLNENVWSQPFNMGDSINTSRDQISPTFTPNGEYFYFVSLGDRDTVLWVSRTNGNSMSKPRLVKGDIQSWYNMRDELKNQIFNKYYTEYQDIYYNNMNKKYPAGYFDNIDKNKIEEIKAIESHNAFHELYESHNIPESFWLYKGSEFSIYPTGKKVIFSEDFGKTGEYGFIGQGDKDIYIADINDDGDWINIKPLSEIINTGLKERYPFIASDGKTMFFNRDNVILKTEYKSDKWTEPVELPSPINIPNTSSWGFKISPSGNKAYFSSNRDGSNKLYEVDLTFSGNEIRQKRVIVVSGIVSDAKTKLPLKADVLIDDLDAQVNIAELETNASTGKYVVSLIRGTRYGLTASSKGYLSKSKKFEIPKTGDFKVETFNIELQPIEIGSSTELSNIEFDFAMATLRPESKLELDRLVDLLNSRPDMKISIEGHTDYIGTDEFNMNLSFNRAKSVRNYLVSKNISNSRLKVSGFGERMPKVLGTDDESRQTNRRVEFRILDLFEPSKINANL